MSWCARAATGGGGGGAAEPDDGLPQQGAPEPGHAAAAGQLPAEHRAPGERQQLQQDTCAPSTTVWFARGWYTAQLRTVNTNLPRGWCRWVSMTAAAAIRLGYLSLQHARPAPQAALSWTVSNPSALAELASTVAKTFGLQLRLQQQPLPARAHQTMSVLSCRPPGH